MSNPEEWKSWEGRVVGGKFPLRQWLGGSDHSAVFLTELAGPGPQKAAIKLIAADGLAERRISRWRATAQLSHPHLMRSYECGRVQIDGSPLLYVVMEFAEEDLSQILPQRALAPGEVTDLLPPLLDALSYLHGKGLVHGRIKPSNVLAVGDLLKLSSDQVAEDAEPATGASRRDVYDAPETSAGMVLPAGDLWSVGATLVTALTQSPPFEGEASPTGAGVPKSIPEPFRGIARECLHLDPKRRCSIAGILARLQPAGRSVPEAAKAPAPPVRGVNRGLMAAGLLVAVVLVGLLVFYSLHTHGKSVTPASSGTVPAVQVPASPSVPPTTTAPAANVPTPEAAPAVNAGASSPGGVVKKVLPEVPISARNTISGTIKVAVRVEVDASGRVTAEKFASEGPSKYFSNLSL